MKKRARIICVFLAAALLAVCCPLEGLANQDYNEAETEVRTWNGFVYTCDWGFDGKKSEISLTILNYKGRKRELTIPKKIDGMKVGSVYSLSKAKNLRTLHIPNGVMFTSSALATAPKLKKITVSKSNRMYSVKNNALLNKKGSVLIDYPGGYSVLRVPGSVTRIGSSRLGYGLWGSRLKSVRWGKNLKVLGQYAFTENNKLETITINGNVHTVGEGAFKGCKKLKKAVLGKNVKRVGIWAFSGCDNLKSVYIYNKNCKIEANESMCEYGLEPDLIVSGKKTAIYGWKGSTAEKYAQKYGLTFKALKK